MDSFERETKSAFGGAQLRQRDTLDRDRPAVQQAGRAPSPQLVSSLTESIRGLRELRSRLSNVNAKLRGCAPECGDAKSPEPEITLAFLAELSARLIEECHNEVAEISALLS